MLAIVLLTYNRLEYARKTLESTLKNIRTQEPIHVHIASDGDTDEYMNELYEFAQELLDSNDRVTSSRTTREGYGANYNYALQTVHNLEGCEYVLPLEDDWELVREFNVDPILGVLHDRVFGCVRMGYIGYTQTLACDFVWHGGYHWLSFREDSSEPHVFAGHPRIETVAWERNVGPWTEGLLPGQTEWDVCHRLESRRQVAWPISLISPEGNAFAHIGAIRSY